VNLRCPWKSPRKSRAQLTDPPNRKKVGNRRTDPGLILPRLAPVLILEIVVSAYSIAAEKCGSERFCVGVFCRQPQMFGKLPCQIVRSQRLFSKFLASSELLLIVARAPWLMSRYRAIGYPERLCAEKICEIRCLSDKFNTLHMVCRAVHWRDIGLPFQRAMWCGSPCAAY